MPIRKVIYFNDRDPVLLEHIKRQENFSAYIRRLILQDLHNNDLRTILREELKHLTLTNDVESKSIKLPKYLLDNVF